ncbi:unnamed protein product [Lupinus luteus]|uniref:Uncharacterized protein n=1 Tax=Lupinus luteus TaxID=3873 RepID=A0AAV1YK55_LUPLU
MLYMMVYTLILKNMELVNAFSRGRQRLIQVLTSIRDRSRLKKKNEHLGLEFGLS